MPQVLHIADVDWQYTNITFRDALTEVKAWSAANPTHTPLAFYVEIKNPGTDSIEGTLPAADLGELDALLGASTVPPKACASCFSTAPSANFKGCVGAAVS